MILVLGGGLAGLSAAYYLRRLLPDEPRLVLEKENEPGGLSRSRAVGGFTFDYTGHYLHVREPEATALVHDLLGDALAPVERRSSIHTHGARLLFPFQANLHGLPPEIVARCLVDFVNAMRTDPPTDATMPFGQWARRVFGDAIAEQFMIPYNAKLFGVPADDLTAEWALWSVPRPDLEQVVRGALGLGNTGMGYNPRFLYPQRGGIGALPGALAERVAGDVRTGAEVVAIDATARTVTLAGGEVLRWNRLVSTMPLPMLLRRVSGLDAGDVPLAELAARLRWNAVLDVALGIDRPGVADGAHWIYFPEPKYPFYRVGFPSNVCAALAPAGCSSLSVEFPHRPGQPVPAAGELVRAAREGLIEAGILRDADRIVAADVALLDPAYVLFDRAHGDVTGRALARLRAAGIDSIGRFGAWEYSYMERALIDGREAARRIASAVAR